MADRAPRRRRYPQGESPPEAEIPSETPQEPRREPKKETPPLPPGKPLVGLQGKLERFFVSMALPFAAAGDMHCAAILAQRGPIVAEAWASLAAESPAVKKVLETLLKGGAWGAAISSTLAVIVPIAAHHGAPIPDFVSPVLFGTEQETRQEQTEREPIVTPPPQSANGSGPTAPGPAAFSAPAVNGSADLTDPAQYPGPHNTTEGNVG